MKKRRVFFDVMTIEKLNKKIAKGKIDIDSIISIQRIDCNHCEVFRWIDKFKDKGVCDFYENESCGDAISRQAVLNTLDRMDKALDTDRTVESYKELLTECYKDLPPVKQEPTDENLHIEREQAYMQGYEDASKIFRQEPCGDAISRQDVIKVLIKNQVHFCDMVKITSEIKDLPSVNPQEPKTGHWINYYCAVTNERWYACSHCLSEVKSKTDYCPSCGYKMESEG